MNEAGLFIKEMTLNGIRFPKNESIPLFFMVHWMQYVLDNFDTLDQVVRSVYNLTIDDWTWHFLPFTESETALSLSLWMEKD